jgi:photosystem II stability/assembly factor-like uncharacterized protein
MTEMDPDVEPEWPPGPSHARRAGTVIAASLLVIAGAGFGYVHPDLGFGATSHAGPTSADAPQASFQLASVDFVSPSVGWVLGEIQPNRFVVLNTTDASASWTRQLEGPSGVLGEYARFFDSSHGVVVALGPQTLLFQTSDGGSTWSRQSVREGGGYVVSAAFVDARNGWLLTRRGVAGPPSEELFRTADGGGSWVGLGDPVVPGDTAFRVAFADLDHGWLYSGSAGPYAYMSVDGGATWRRVSMPAPPGGWPATPQDSVVTQEFFVAARPTQGTGVMATVIGIASGKGRAVDGEVLVDYPPLKVRTFDGGGSVTYVYADVSPYRYSSIEYVNPGLLVAGAPANQFQLSSVDGGLSWTPVLAPSNYGAIGYVDALDWRWIGSGAGSTSSDGGATWTQVRGLGVPEPLPGSLQYLDASHAWFGAMAGTRPLVETTDDGGVHWTMKLLPPITL